ncbi:MAG: nicotinate-nucleotide adenylyltransferase [Desulfitobacteriia bacterium]
METEQIVALKDSKRLGIMGGTFDPIHYGHLVAAETARVELGLDKVLFMPTGDPPHKSERKITDSGLRFKMVEMSIKSNENFLVSRMEIDRQGPSYTIDTLKELARIFPKQELYFITGTDALMEILSWREPEEVIKLAKIIGASRPGYEWDERLERIITQYPFTKERILQLEIPALAISSTDIRAKVAAKKSIRYLLPDEVRLFIKENKLYR